MPAKPVIFTLDDDPEVLQAIQRDLRREFGKEYRIMRADGGAEALDALQQMKLRNDEVALFLVDQRMPEISGVEFLGRAREFFPNAKRALLTAYADTSAAIQ
ncbi:MAG: response regulator, partial [Chloroflexota bacterium]